MAPKTCLIFCVQANAVSRAELMDVILQALDAVNAMFADVQNREPLTPADPAIIEALHRLSMPESEDELQAHHAAPAEL